MKTASRVAWLATGLLVAQSLVGCGGDEGGDAPTAPAAGAAGTAGSGGASGKGGSGGAAGKGGSGGSAGSIGLSGSGGSAGSGGGFVSECKSDSECKGFSCCDGQCVDTKTDILNCSKCGNKCPGADTQQALCAAGVCSSCAAGKADCNLLAFDNCEVTLATDSANCGGCGKVCLLANASANKCVDGGCQIDTCKAGFLDCDKKHETGCEIDTANDPANCGGCGKACPAVANAKTTCGLGVCGKFVCNAGFADCDGKPENGCEVDLLKDLTNCGKCGEACEAVAHGQPACTDGICVIGSCDTGYNNCDGSTGNGCETDLAVDVNHCGACGQKCSAETNSDAQCNGGFCGTGVCNPGYDDCDANVIGCEVNLSTDALNCGVCGNPCPPVTNGQPKCELFACGIGSCDKGWKHCVGGEENGCETDILNDSNNCGDCSSPCPPVTNGSGLCADGQCVIAACEGNFRDCDAAVANGCEADVTKDKLNCGDCNNPCPDPPNATGKCDAGLCGVATCEKGFSNCDNNDANGCELPTDFDPENCGGCGVICGSGQCDSGQCICNDKVLLIVDDSPNGAAPLIAAFQSVGLSVEVAKDGNGVEIPIWKYAGSPTLTGKYGSVVVLSGGPITDPNGNSAITDIPPEGQQALVDFVKASNGLVLTEWAAQHVASGRWQLLQDYILLERTLSFTGSVTYKVDSAFASHPLWEGLGESFKFSSTSNVGLVKLGNGNKRIASSPEALDAVAIRDEPKQGRVAHLAHAGSYNDNGWANPDITRLVANAAKWAARCKLTTPPGSPSCTALSVVSRVWVPLPC